MKRTVCVLLGWALLAGGVAQGQEKRDLPKKTPDEKNEAVQILRQADEAIKAVKLVKYKGSFEVIGWEKGQIPSLEGTAIIGGGFDRYFEKFRLDLKVREGESSEVEEFVVGGNGDKFFLLDPQKNIAYENTKPTVVGYANAWVSSLCMAEFVHPTPFDDEINAEKVELKGTEKVGDEECYVIHVVYSEARGMETDWYFSKKDLLPRRADRITVHKIRGKSVKKLVITDLIVDPKIDKDTFELALPEGFEKTDKSAPWRRPK